MENITITPFSTDRVKQVYQLVRETFDAFVGYDYSEEGNNTFYDFIEPDNMIGRFNNGGIILIAYSGAVPVGMIEVYNNSHISLFFVHKDYHNRGIGRSLLDRALHEITAKGAAFIDVHASPYSEQIYTKLGFTATGPLQEENGIKFIPMKMAIKTV